MRPSTTCQCTKASPHKHTIRVRQATENHRNTDKWCVWCENSASEVSLTLSAADVLLCRHSGAALEGPQAPCEHVSLCPIQAAPLSYLPFQMDCSSRILPVNRTKITLCMSQTPNHPKRSCCFSYPM